MGGETGGGTPQQPDPHESYGFVGVSGRPQVRLKRINWGGGPQVSYVDARWGDRGACPPWRRAGPGLPGDALGAAWMLRPQGPDGNHGKSGRYSAHLPW